ncbi:TetR/AcrR family transcriptional regulator [soil metagenome]
MERADAIVTPLHETRSGIRVSGDPRVVRTRQAILDAVETLASGDEPISVAAIVRTAGIARSSFYTHFSGIDELAVTVLGGVFDAIGAEDVELRRHRIVSGAEAARVAQVRLVGHLVQHRALYASMLALPFTSAVYTRAVQGYAAQVRATIGLLPEIPAGVSADAVAIYTASGSLGLLAHWIRSGDHVPADVLVDQLMSLVPAWLAAP